MLKRVAIVQDGIDRLFLGLFNPAKHDLSTELTHEALGFQRRIPIFNSKSPFKLGFKFYNNGLPSGQSKKLIIHFDRKSELDPREKRKAHFKHDGAVQFISTRWDQWKPEEIEDVIQKLSEFVRVYFGTLFSIEFYCDVERHPCLRGWTIRLTRNNARSTSRKRPSKGGYTEGTLKGGRGALAKFYPKNECFFAQRPEVALGRNKLRKEWGCQTLGEALRLDPYAVLCREARFIAVRDSDWSRIIRKPNRRKRIMNGFKSRGPVWVCHNSISIRYKKFFDSLTKKEKKEHFSLTTARERKRFHKLKVKLAVHEVILAPGELEMDKEGND